MTAGTVDAPPRTSRILAAWRSTGRSDLDSHVAVHGPLALPGRADTAWTSGFVAELEASGLQGRGGASFAAWRKVAAHVPRRRGAAPAVVVNALEGEPASEKHRVLLSFAPNLVLDGAQLAAVAIGAQRVIVCSADDEPVIAESVLRTIGERRARGIDRVPSEVASVPAGFVSGEESAVASSLAGRRARPTFRTDKSAPLLAFGHPLLVHNVETFAHVALVSRYGADWFRQVGTSESPGTALVTVSGAVARRGVYEIALGTSVSEIVEGAAPCSAIGSAVVGGFAGGVVGSAEMHRPFCRESLAAIGASPGPGVVIALPESVCGVAETARVARYLAGESSGQCGPCVFGLAAIADSLDALWRGSAAPDTFSVLARRLGQVDGRGACRHPDGAVRFVSSALRAYAGDFRTHAAGRPCRWHSQPSLLGVGDRRSEGGHR